MVSPHAETGGDFDDPKAGSTLYIGIIGVVILIATVVLVQTMQYDEASEIQAEFGARDYLEIRNLKSEQQSQLESFGWTYPEEDRVRIPVQQGVERVMEQYGQGDGRQ